MQTFTLNRASDETGVSGTGVVLEGVIFDDGRVVIRWLPGNAQAQSTACYDTYQDFRKIHVDSHPKNGSVITFYDCVPASPS